MTTPVRIQLSRAKGFRLQAHSRAINGLPAVKVDRTTNFGNPCTPPSPDSLGRAWAVMQYRQYCPPDSALAEQARRLLRGKNLCCWCPLPAPGEPDNCHAIVLLEIANAQE
jgi:hypothetical protein